MVAVPSRKVEHPTTSAMASNPDPSVGEECQEANLDVAVEVDVRSLDL
jgi:hypothetical protein